jgi:enoyl-CoA hydratase
MSYECFEVEVAGGVAHVRLSRPDELNTLVPAFWRELPELTAALDRSGEVRVVVLSSTGRHFSAGMDLDVLAGELTAGPTGDGSRGRARLRDLVLALQGAVTSLERLRVPVLAAVQGGCVGGGLDLVTACDVRYATADAFFVVQEVNIAMVADLGTLQRLPRLIPDGAARELAYTGRRLPAERALRLGLVDEVFATHAELLAGVGEIAGEIAARSPLAVAGSKEALLYARDHTVADGLDRVATWQAGMLAADDLAEAFTARAEQRDAAYADLEDRPTGL